MNNKDPANHNKAILVVAHPDDEALWFSSIIDSISKLIICYGDIYGEYEISKRRANAVSDLPLSGVINLAIPEAGVFTHANWSQPTITEAGIAITDDKASVRYETNFRRLCVSLPGLLEGADIVYTHNPWGEYGHPEHVQVHNAIRTLQCRMGYSMAFSNYISTTSVSLGRMVASQYPWDKTQQVMTNRLLAKRLRRIYLAHGVWTWHRAYWFPSHETMYTIHPGRKHEHDSLTGTEVWPVERLCIPCLSAMVKLCMDTRLLARKI